MCCICNSYIVKGEGHREQKLFLDTLFQRTGKSLFGSPRRKEVYLRQFATPYPGSQFFETKDSLGITLCCQWWDFVSTRINFIPYSLLQDSPQCGTLQVSDYIEMLDAFYYKVPSSFHPGMKMKQAHRLTEALKTFFSLCNGERTLKDIALSLKKEYNCRWRTALKFTAIASVIASQCGLFSPKREKTRNVKPGLYYVYYVYVWFCLHFRVKKKSVKNALIALVGG